MDALDKKILNELSFNARQTYKQIATKIKSKKDTVAYRISQLEKQKIISKYVPVISLAKLGIFAGKIYFQLKGMSNEKEKELMIKLNNNKNIVWIAKSIGSWDLMLGFLFTSLDQFSQMKKEVIELLNPFIENMEVLFIEEGLVFDRNYLYNQKKERTNFEYRKSTTREFIEDIDYQILNLIKNNGRYEYKQLCSELKKDFKTIQKRIKYLESKKILQGNTTFLNIEKIGFQLYKICIFLKNRSEESINNIVNKLKENPNTIHIIRQIGSWELEIEIEDNSTNKIHKYIQELKKCFTEEIRKIELNIIQEEVKLDFFPDYKTTLKKQN